MPLTSKAKRKSGSGQVTAVHLADAPLLAEKRLEKRVGIFSHLLIQTLFEQVALPCGKVVLGWKKGKLTLEQLLPEKWDTPTAVVYVHNRTSQFCWENFSHEKQLSNKHLSDFFWIFVQLQPSIPLSQ